MGIAPQGTTSGDTLFVLKDCDVPVVMRAIPNKQYFHLIRMSFLFGRMDGELAEFVNDPETRRRWIEIR